ncbi:hypothetical protein, partial [Klebsiella pneumoniae]|uniref:hypothetical protein n=1 Tax=Klebsiella pneumoniae TaxID=573 RepID=UPI001CA5806A
MEKLLSVAIFPRKIPLHTSYTPSKLIIMGDSTYKELRGKFEWCFFHSLPIRCPQNSHHIKFILTQKL